MIFSNICIGRALRIAVGITMLALSLAGGTGAATITVDNVQAQQSSYDLLGSYKTEGWVFAVSANSSGSFIAGSYSGKIYSFNREGKLLWNRYPQDGLKEMKVCPNGEYIALRYERQVRPFNINGNQLNVNDLPSNGGVSSLSISPDCSYIAAGYEKQNEWSGPTFDIFIFKTQEARWSEKNANADRFINTLSISSNGSYIAIGSGDKDRPARASSENMISIIKRDEDLFYPIWSLQTDSEVRIVSISTDGSVLSSVAGNNIYFYDINHRRLSEKNMPGINTLSISSNGSYIAAGSGNNVYLFNRSGTLLWSHNMNYSITDVIVSLDGARIAAGSGRDIYIFDNGGTLLWSYRAENDVLSVSLSPNGNYAAAGSKDQKVYFIGEKVSPSIIPVIPATSTKPEVPIISASTRTPEAFQNLTTPIKSSPFPSVFFMIMLLIVWRLKCR